MVEHKIWKIKHPDVDAHGPNTLLIYTGGTLGMVFDPKENTLVPFSFDQILDYLPEIKRVKSHFTIVEFLNPIDSSDMNPAIWIDLAKLIEANYEDHSGFVILHGTDTMAFTGSSLSFLLANLDKPVILTGAQLPIGVARSDARENLITALELGAKSTQIREVCIYFNGKLLRANRSKKYESELFDAFASENYPLLGEVGVSISIFDNRLFPKSTPKELQVQDSLCTDVFILKLFPGITTDSIVEFILAKGIKGVILETYGAGNAPSDAKFLKMIDILLQNEIAVFNVSQCTGGAVNQESYATGKGLKAKGVISGKDITTEAAIAKMMYLLAQDLGFATLQSQLSIDLRGEMLAV
ncbi:asparaginase [Spirosomataceae bacterium TFI 002]|nr:asparaginase [Spirosomataceae bacterium TFI 002]